MEYRTLDLTLISAKGLKNASLIGKMDVYAVASISGSRHQKLKTPVNKGGGPNPTWNFPMKFTVNEPAAMHNRQSDDALIIIKIKAVGWFVNTELGQVHVPIKELMEEGVNNNTTQGMAMKSVSFPVIRKRSGKPKGDVTFSYKFGGKFTRKPAATTSYNHQQQPGKEATKKAATTSSGPHQRRVKKKTFNAVRKQVPNKNTFDMSAIATHHGGGCAGSCCGGGCGGGGCGGGFDCS